MNALKNRLSAFAVALLFCAALWVPALADVAPRFDPPNQLERNRQALYAFLDAAFTVEYHNEGRDYMLRWEKPIRISLEGTYTSKDEAFLDAFLAEVTNRAADGEFTAFPGIARVQAGGKANVRVIFCPLDEMDSYLTFYEPDNWGLFEYYYDNYRIYRGAVVVANDVTTQRQRNHLLMEELVGVMGLTNDIYTYSDSIVYQAWTETQQLSDLDWLMLGYLYSDLVKPGMTSVQAYAQLLPGVLAQ